MRISCDEIDTLSVADLALRLLRDLASSDGIQFSRYIALLRIEEDISTGIPISKYSELQLQRIANAWGWLEAHALLVPSVNGGENARVVSELGYSVLDDGCGLTTVFAQERLSGNLCPELCGARSIFALGEYESACLVALKEVEVAVRNAGGFSTDVYGNTLMRKAFDAKDGPLRDPDAQSSEREAVANLFSGVMGAYRNAASHRTVSFSDPTEAAEVIQLADLLMRIVTRARKRRESASA